MRPHFALIPVPVVETHHQFVCRARPNYNGEIFNHKKHLSYPPDPAKIKEQRANYQGQQVFYAALPPKRSTHTLGHCQYTALLETAWEHISDYRHLNISRVYFARKMIRNSVTELVLFTSIWLRNF